MRSVVAILLFSCLAIGLSAQSATISKEKLDELIQLLAVYGQIPPQLDKLGSRLDDLGSQLEAQGTKLADLRTSLDQRTSDLQSGFDQYKKVVDTEIMPRLERDERTLAVQSWTTWIAVGGASGAVVGSFGGKPVDSALGALGGMIVGTLARLARDLVK